MRGVVLVFLLRTTPQECVIRKGKLKETFVTVMGKIAGRPVFDGFIRPGPEVASMVMTLKMMVPVTVMMMLAMATLAMWDLWGLWGLRDLWDLWYLWGFWDLWDLRDHWDAAGTGRFTCSIHGATSLCRSCSGPNLRAIAAR